MTLINAIVFNILFISNNDFIKGKYKMGLIEGFIFEISAIVATLTLATVKCHAPQIAPVITQTPGLLTLLIVLGLGQMQSHLGYPWTRQKCILMETTFSL